MYCNTCQVEVQPMVDQWKNARCPSCKQMMNAQANPVKASGDLDSGQAAKQSESGSPAYTEYLRKKNVIRENKKSYFDKIMSKIRGY